MLSALFALALTLGSPQQPLDHVRMYLVTMDPGGSAYEYFGHNAIWIQDPNAGTNVAWNWGVFDFNEPGFYQKFLKGYLIYQMAGHDMGAMLSHYEQRLNRSVHIQELNLTAAQKQVLYDYVQWNARPENVKYRYHYYKDNCSTRVRDVIDRALGGALRQQLEPRTTGTTYRSETQRLTAHDAPVYTGLMLAMGPNIDVPLNAWTESFIPMRLQHWARSVSNGGQPLVGSERTLFQSTREPAPAEAGNHLPYFLIAGVLFAGLLALLGSLRARAARIGFISLAALFELVIGLAGTIVMLLWFFTEHEVTYRNENVLQANVFSLVLFSALVALALRKAWAPKIAGRFAAVVAGLSVLGAAIQVLPGLDQANGEIIALLLPVHVVLAWLLLRPSPLWVEEQKPAGAMAIEARKAA